jgi:RimJ/RimL family protein N-acetyltransferase
LSQPARWELGEYVCDIRDRAGAVVGQISYSNLDRVKGRAELGIELGAEHRGKGYGPEAIRLLLRQLFDHEGLSVVYLRVRHHNRPARRAYEKVGFRYVATARWPLVGIIRYLVMEISREEFLWRRLPD